MYADKITGSMQRTIDETERRRAKQKEYNKINNIEPRQIARQVRSVLGKSRDYQLDELPENPLLADPVMAYLKPEKIKEAIDEARREMERAATDLDFLRAAKFRDQMVALRNVLEKRGK
jgi:excinuclease ABC subunit B